MPSSAELVRTTMEAKKGHQSGPGVAQGPVSSSATRGSHHAPFKLLRQSPTTPKLLWNLPRRHPPLARPRTDPLLPSRRGKCLDTEHRVRAGPRSASAALPRPRERPTAAPLRAP